MTTRLYLAYGSNLHPVRLADRVPGARAVGTTRLEGYRLLFAKRGRDGTAKCTLAFTGRAGDVAYGAVFEIPVREKHLLDAAEGLGNGYDEAELAVSLDDREATVFTYIASPAHLDFALLSHDWYHRLVVTGARHHGFPPEYLTHLESFPVRADAHAERRTLHEQLLARIAAYSAV